MEGAAKIILFGGNEVTATATNEATGDTSEFSAPVTLVNVGKD